MCVDIGMSVRNGLVRSLLKAVFMYLNHICCRGTAVLCPYRVVYLPENSCNTSSRGDTPQEISTLSAIAVSYNELGNGSKRDRLCWVTSIYRVFFATGYG
jgi:hypothetical protein